MEVKATTIGIVFFVSYLMGILLTILTGNYPTPDFSRVEMKIAAFFWIAPFIWMAWNIVHSVFRK